MGGHKLYPNLAIRNHDKFVTGFINGFTSLPCSTLKILAETMPVWDVTFPTCFYSLISRISRTFSGSYGLSPEFEEMHPRDIFMQIRDVLDENADWEDELRCLCKKYAR